MLAKDNSPESPKCCLVTRSWVILTLVTSKVLTYVYPHFDTYTSTQLSLFHSISVSDLTQDQSAILLQTLSSWGSKFTPTCYFCVSPFLPYLFNFWSVICNQSLIADIFPLLTITHMSTISILIFVSCIELSPKWKFPLQSKLLN